jgi:general nucleoside transport system permease protein
LKETLKGISLAVVASALAVALVLMALAACGYPPLAVAREWMIGPLSTSYDIAACLKYACPLLLTGLAAGVAFRCGVLNIGAEGQALMGAAAATAVATKWMPHVTPWIVITLALAAGIAAGAAWAFIAALLDRLRGVPVVLSTILLNFIALYLLRALLLGPLQAAGTTGPQSEHIAAAIQLPILLSHTGLHAGVLLAFVLALIAWLVQSRTTFGFELLVTGMNPTAALLSGIPVARRQGGVMLISGGFAGLAGAIQLLGVTHALDDKFTGYGYAGIAVAMLGRLHPIGIAAAALFFGILDRGADAVESNPDLLIKHDVADIVKGVVVLAMLVGTAYLMRKRTTAKQAG